VSISVHLRGKQKRQVALITAGALVLFVLVRHLPTGTNLAHVDFQGPGGRSLQFCDPANPAFMPVLSVRSPVTLTLAPDSPPSAGRPMRVVLFLRTASGKAIGPQDLLVTHTRLLHLMVVDPGLRDYQHLHPEPGNSPGEWTVEFTPRRAGRYRVFADFTPAATARGLYAAAELEVPGNADLPPAEDNWVYEADGWRFTLAADAPLRARAVVNLALTVEAAGGPLPLRLEPVMGAYAHLVAIDAARSGFAHLHPRQSDLNQALDSLRPRLAFQVQIPDAGRYVVWSQVKIDGQERFAPFWIEVEP
jgi:hypothetical protein